MDAADITRLNFKCMNARTKTLFHFTKSLDTLMRILKEGFWPQYSLEDITWVKWRDNISRVAWPMVSFCDIPISRLRNHTVTYGNYGVGLCRERWRVTGLNPVFYVSPDSIVRDFLRELLVDAAKNQNLRTKTAGMYTLGSCKPLEDKKVGKDFYSECEWRFLPWVEGVGGENKFGFFLPEDQFHDDRIRKEANAERRNDRMLKFPPDYVRYLLVNTKQDVPKLIQFIDTKMPAYPRLKLDLLKTRIIVLDEISGDL